MAKPLLDISRLTPDERIDLATALWDSLAEAPDAVPLTDEQAEELDRRLEAYRQDRDPGTPWREALQQIERSGA
jgi:putative addiction module component (TIGR02574 family)